RIEVGQSAACVVEISPYCERLDLTLQAAQNRTPNISVPHDRLNQCVLIADPLPNRAIERANRRLLAARTWELALPVFGEFPSGRHSISKLNSRCRNPCDWGVARLWRGTFFGSHLTAGPGSDSSA